MAHCRFEDLADLRSCLDQIRSWPEIREPRPGVFYVKRVAFLHFHVDKQARRWADVRDGATWGSEVDMPADAGAARRRAFVREVQRRYRATLATLVTPARGAGARSKGR